MADSMNKTVMDKAVKETVVEALNPTLETVGAVKIDDYTYAFPVTVDGEDTYAKVTITAVQRKATKTLPAFDIDTALAKYQTKIDEREARVAEREAKKAAKLAKANSDAE
jgi:hypothetical protein